MWPRSIRNPLNMGPVHVNLPSLNASTVNSPESGTWPGTPEISPKLERRRVPDADCVRLPRRRAVDQQSQHRAARIALQ